MRSLGFGQTSAEMLGLLERAYPRH
jgi:hypothetical protein